MDVVVTLLFCLTIPTGAQSGADGSSFMRPHPFLTPKLCCADIHVHFENTKMHAYTHTHKQSLKDRLQIKETHQTSNSLAASGSSQGNSLPCQAIQEVYISRFKMCNYTSIHKCFWKKSHLNVRRSTFLSFIDVWYSLPQTVGTDIEKNHITIHL